MNETMKLLKSLAAKGEDNDRLVSDKNKKYLNITHDTGEFLSVITKATSAKRILEIGTSNGYSTIWLAYSLCETGQVITIECDPDKAQEAQANFKKANLNERIRLVKGEVSDVLPPLNEQFDLVFLDADRSIYMNILDDILRLTKRGGVIICDNAISHYDEIKDLIDYFNRQQGYTTCLVPVGKGEFTVYKGVD
ncbi:O-methyltransferase [Salinivibrio sp. KP-1]|uniref:O-methyltransferase n=1 Tax=Salinivibrio sp. KP-1 TaxID=1406902 RepID=UPI0006148321|nr:O-methyltransferase [Salinivibrio sp. KP-1]KKA44673.1 methyltransferase [Salinivibrio sp. KP-1]